jgi:hypothetical protein
MEILKSVADNREIFETLRKLFIDEFTKDEVNTLSGASDELLGQITRARLDGLRKVESVFRQIEAYKTPKPSEPSVNPAR